MDMPVDETTRKYMREIRIGMALLGVLAILFVGVLARRVWMENSQISASTKKPIYLSRVERDALRAKTKPLPLYSVHATSRPREMASSRSGQRAAAQANLEREAEQIPDLEIGEAPPEESESRPASFLERDDSSTDKSKGTTEPRENPNAKENASPIRAAEQLEDEQSSQAEQETKAESAAEPQPTASRFSGIQKPRKSETDKPEATAHLNAPAGDQPTEKPEPPATPEVENVRKKSERNPWKRSDGETSSKPNGPLHTVVKGETLKSIARDIFDNESRWREIYDLNREQIGDDFGYLRLGMKLRLPPLSESPPLEDEPPTEASKVRDP
jgi:nucleoid-associated protein YgaU